jgi:hypothetical protein
MARDGGRSIISAITSAIPWTRLSGSDSVDWQQFAGSRPTMTATGGMEPMIPSLGQHREVATNGNSRVVSEPPAGFPIVATRRKHTR